ncbi:UNVERIFIED_CONTAM: hypothetical protein GTU68_023148 [Idotea baltica]|nr:hypothetical protein [Idotea baltica]
MVLIKILNSLPRKLRKP